MTWNEIAPTNTKFCLYTNPKRKNPQMKFNTDVGRLYGIVG